MKTKWQNAALTALFKTYHYIIDNYGVRRANKFLLETKKIEKIISKNPQIASRELLLEARPIFYRSINIDDINKMIYTIENDTISIVDIWDMRRSPDNLSKNI